MMQILQLYDSIRNLTTPLVKSQYKNQICIGIEIKNGPRKKLFI